MDEKERGEPARRADDEPRRFAIRIDSEQRPSTTLWRMRSAAGDSQASCSVSLADQRCEVLITFTKGFAIPEYFPDVGAALRHSMAIAGRLTALGWIDLDLSDR